MPARIYPNPLPDWVLVDPLREAEIEVYEILKRQLSSRYSVFYSRPWIGTNFDGTEKEGEADFVVASPDTGYLVIEVKGGGVGRDGQTGEWFSIDRHNRRHTIRDPIKQALRSKNEILEKLRQFPGMDGRWIGMGSAVILPHSTGGGLLVGADTPADHFAFSEDMAHLGRWVVERLEHTVSDRGGSLGVDGIASLERLLAQSFQLRIPLALTIGDDHEKVVSATEQQYTLLEFLQGHNRAAIGGAAGSGKTILALHKATELAKKAYPSQVLLTCYNAPLAAWLRLGSAKETNLRAGTFHEICIQTAKAAGVAASPCDNTQKYFDEVLPNLLLESIDLKPDMAFAGIVIDEGQDFSDRWLDVLQLSLRDESSPFWVFYDDNQKVYSRTGFLLQTMDRPPFMLRKNVRNPRPIFDRLVPFLDGSTVVPLGPRGRPIEEITVSGLASLRSRLAGLITRLVEDDQVDPEDVAVLVARKESIVDVCPDGRFGRIPTCDAEAGGRGRVCIDTVRRFKGLERKVVILIEPTEIAKNEELMYVALSRPTAHLILLGTKPLRTVEAD